MLMNALTTRCDRIGKSCDFVANFVQSTCNFPKYI